MYGERIARWERAVEWPLLIAALLFLVAYAYTIVANPTGLGEDFAEATLWVTWALFVVDYGVRLAITEHRGRWFVRHLLDLAIVMLPVLRPLRLLRFITILTLINRGVGSRLRGKVAVYTVGGTILLILIAGLAVLDAERGSSGDIQSLGDAIWWAFVTITTVGYGDYYPVTLVGRIVAVGLMIGGIALIGVVTATIASWIVERVQDGSKRSAAATEQQVDSLRAEIAELKAMVAELRPAR